MRFSSLSFALALTSLAACSSSTSEPGTPDEDTGTASDTAVADTRTSDTRSDAPSDTQIDSTKTDSVSIDSTSTDSSATDTSVTDSAGGDTAVTDAPTDTATTDVGDASATCSIDVLTGKSTGCTATEYCDAPSCTTGVCKPRPTATTDFAPACGCDGVTYWNATYARSLGTSVPSGVGACGTGKKTCGGIAGITCPSATDTCVGDHSGIATTCGGADLGGQCWSIPSGASCSGVIGFTSYRVCGGSSSGCRSYCDAVKSGRDFFKDSLCPT
jgi:hypothetical protein